MAEKNREDTRAKRELILDAARTLFAQKGYEETTIPEIARVAGVAVGTVYLYFRNKHELLTNVAVDIDAEILQALRDPALFEIPLGLAMRVLMETMFRIGRQKRQHIILLQVNLESAEEIEQRKHHDAQLIEALDGLLRHAVAQGHLAPFNTEMYAQLLYQLGRSVLHQCYAIENGEREDIYRQTMVECVERLFFGPPLSQQPPGN